MTVTSSSWSFRIVSNTEVDISVHDAQSMNTRWENFTQRMFNQNQFAIKLGLDSMNRALDLSSLTHLSHKVILVAGTNGKGTLASTMSSLLSASGLKVGLYTSPHLVDFTERFRINGQIISREDVLPIGLDVLDKFADPESSPCLTFFELTTMIAVRLFEHHQVDVAIYEVGMGGRLDATNALEPDLCVLGSIGFDHQTYLGDTIEHIAHEKLGITRPDVPLFVSHQDHQGADALLSMLRHVPLFIFGRNLGIQSNFDPEWYRPEYQVSQPEEDNDSERDVIWWYHSNQRHNVEVEEWGGFKSWYQRCHLTTAIAAAHYTLTQLLQDSACANTLVSHLPQIIPRMRWPGRLEIIHTTELLPQREVELLCDAAHNPDGVQSLFEFVRDSDYRPEFIVFSSLADKSVEHMLHVFSDWLSDYDEDNKPAFYVAELDTPRAASSQLLKEACARAGVSLSHAPQPTSALLGIIGESLTPSSLKSSDELVRGIVFGSIYLLGECFQALKSASQTDPLLQGE